METVRADIPRGFPDAIAGGEAFGSPSGRFGAGSGIGRGAVGLWRVEGCGIR